MKSTMLIITILLGPAAMPTVTLPHDNPTFGTTITLIPANAFSYLLDLRIL